MATSEKKSTDPLLCKRGRRVRMIRLALRLSRPGFQRKFGVSKGTLQNWEDARFGGLGEHGARRLIKVLAPEQIHCTVEWLLYGIGVDPLVKWRELKQIPAPKEKKASVISSVMQAELEFFHEQHKNVIDAIMPDEAMAPRIFANDLVAGVRYFQADIARCIGRDCIIQTQEGKTWVRHLVSGSENNGYILSCPYTGDKNQFPDMQQVAVFCAAPILWIRSAD